MAAKKTHPEKPAASSVTVNPPAMTVPGLASGRPRWATRAASRGLVLAAITLGLFWGGMTGSASATVTRIQGGSGRTNTIVANTTYRTIQVHTQVTQDYPTSSVGQTLGSDVYLFTPNSNTPIDLHVQTYTTYPAFGGSPTVKFDFVPSFAWPAGWYYVRVWYGWQTAAGWNWLSEDFGWYWV